MKIISSTTKLFLVFYISSLFLINCNGGSINIRNGNGIPKDVHDSNSENLNRMIDSLKSINKRSPDTFMATFTIDGSVKRKKFKSIGLATFIKKTRMFNATFRDYIFKSPITLMSQEGDKLKLYFPIDKKIFVDNVNTIRLSNYSDIDINYNIIYELITGKIPLIRDYKVRKGFMSHSEKVSYLILENKQYYETISFRNDHPEKIKFFNKFTKNEFEIYLKKCIKKKGTHFFSKIRIIDKIKEMQVDFNFKIVKLNIPVKVKKIEDLKIPKDVMIIRM